MEMLLEQAIKNLEYMCNHSNLEHDRRSLRTVIKFVESYDERLKADMVTMLQELQLEIEESENCGKAFHLGLQMASNIIQQKITELEE